MRFILLILLTVFFFKSFEPSSSKCSYGLDSLNNPRLDFIADAIVDIKAKDNLSSEDYKKLNQLQEEEDAIWKNAERGC
jgi:hypothetical protein